jgi:hypothetical protein
MKKMVESRAPPDGPAALDDASRLAPMLGRDDLADEDGARRPLTAKPNALEGPGDEQLLE